MKPRFFLPLVLACLAALLAPLQSAYKGHADDKDVQALLSVYPALQGTAADSCATCHRSGRLDGAAGSAQAVDFLAADGYETTFTLVELRKAWPQSRPVAGLGRQEPCDARVPEAQRFHEGYDHNAGKSSYAIAAVRVRPLPGDTRDVDWRAAAPRLAASQSVLFFGALEARAAPVERALGPGAAQTPARSGAAQGARPARTAGVLRLATTTSTEDTGLLKAILPDFERQCACRVDVVAVGTGQALEIARRGDADVVLVHSRPAEEQFLAEGHARERHDVMYNDFVIVGPADDPARIAGKAQAADAFTAIARAAAPFVSRGDKSGTEAAEKRIWAAAGLAPAGQRWYRSLGQGMGETLVAAQELGAYTLSDRGTWLSMKERLPRLRQLLGGATILENPDTSLRNQYGVMAVSPEAHPGVNFAAAQRFVAWLLSPATQGAIGDFGRPRFGQSLFYPMRPKAR